jgi:hypothetical protein
MTTVGLPPGGVRLRGAAWLVLLWLLSAGALAGDPQEGRHIAAQVVELVPRAEGGRCRWDPPNEKLWMRVIYCDWMLGENWQFKGGLHKGWFRPAAADPAP